MYLSTVVYLYFCCLVYNHKIRGKLHAKVVKRSQITCNRWGIHKSQIVLEKGMYMGGRGGAEKSATGAWLRYVKLLMLHVFPHFFRVEIHALIC